MIGNSKQKPLTLTTQPDDKVSLYNGSADDGDQNYIAILIQHVDTSATLEIYAVKTWRRQVSVNGLYVEPYCPQTCAAWNGIAHRAAFTFQNSQNRTQRLLLIALDTGVVQSFDLDGLAEKHNMMQSFASEIPLEMKWSPNGQYLTYVAKINQKDASGTLSLFNMNGQFQLSIEPQTCQAYGGEGYVYPVVIWSKDSQQIFYNHYSDTDKKDYYSCSSTPSLWLSYNVLTKQIKQLAQLDRFSIVLPDRFNPAGTRALIQWIDEKGTHRGIIDVRTGQKTSLIDGSDDGYVHWTDRGFTWIEDFAKDGLKIIWMANETAPRHEVAFPGEGVDFGYSGLHPGRQLPPELIWNRQALVMYLISGSEEDDTVMFSTWLINLKTAKARRLAHERYRTTIINSPDNTMLALLPNWGFINIEDGLPDAYMVLVSWNEAIADIRLPVTPAPYLATWSPNSAMLAYTQNGGDFLSIINRQGKLLRQYPIENLASAFYMEWTAACLPGESLD